MTPEVAYTAADLVAKSGATPRQVNHWSTEGVLVAGVRQSTGRGDHRLFDAYNVLQAAVGAQLAAFKVTLPTLRWVLGAPLADAYRHDDAFLVVLSPDRAASGTVAELPGILRNHNGAIVLHLARLRRQLDV